VVDFDVVDPTWDSSASEDAVTGEKKNYTEAPYPPGLSIDQADEAFLNSLNELDREILLIHRRNEVAAWEKN